MVSNNVKKNILGFKTLLRIQKTAWLYEGASADTSDLVARYNNRLSVITGLDTKTAEPLQVGNYGIGGRG